MDLWILNGDFEQIGIVDLFKSLIWTPRYSKVGDCEIYVAASSEMLQLLQRGYYIYRTDSDMICKIKTIEIDTNTETGNYLIVKGYDCKDILGQRIVWSQTNFSGTAENFIRKIVDENLITTTAARVIPHFALADSHGYTERIETQSTYDSVLEKVQSVCDRFGYGFRVTFDGTDLRFDVCKGADRSADQTENDAVIFSPEFENIASTSYSVDATNVATLAKIAGEGEGTARKVTEYDATSQTGFDRFEIYVDARDVSMSRDGEEEPMSEEEYIALLKERGAEKLTEYGIKTSFDGEVEPNRSYVFGVDYFLGDIVTVRNEYGIQVNARVTEVIEAFDDNGHTVIPKFEFLEVQQS